MMVSVDGYFEGQNHDLSWHNVDAEFNAFAEAQLGEADTLLFGRRTYDLMASWWPTPQGAADDPTVAKLMNEMPKIVVSQEPFIAEWNATTVVSADVASEIAKLKSKPGKDILLLGSNMLCVSLIQEGLVDELRIMVNPVALGSGTPLFAGLPARLKLRLLKTREFASGNVLQYYSKAGMP